MVNRIYVTGFKSLVDFNLELKPGINALIGSNGSGKTNIIELLQFVSEISGASLQQAVSSIGGLGKLFTKIEGEEWCENITLKIDGSCQLLNEVLNYHLEYIIASNDSKDFVHFSKQLVCIGVNRMPLVDEKNLRKNDIYLEYIHKKDDDNKRVYAFGKSKLKKIFQKLEFKENYFERFEMLYSDVVGFYDERRFSYVTIFSRMFDSFMMEISSDLTFNKCYNIVPKNILRSEDISMVAGVRPDGYGLATTLNAMKHNRENILMDFFRQRDSALVLNSSGYEKVELLLSAANENFEGLHLKYDASENKIAIYCVIQSEVNNSTRLISINSLSDGTLKWLALVTAIVSTARPVSIEEPENYLHPWMQEKLIDLLREKLDEQRRLNFSIITTHSESVINSLKPEELVLVQMNNGITSARRIQETERVKEVLKTSQWGLSFFYLKDSL